MDSRKKSQTPRMDRKTLILTVVGAALVIAIIVIAVVLMQRSGGDPYQDNYDAAMEHYVAGEYGEALDAARRAYSAEATEDAVLIIARSYAALGDLGGAVEALEGWAATGGSGAEASRAAGGIPRAAGGAGTGTADGHHRRRALRAGLPDPGDNRQEAHGRGPRGRLRPDQAQQPQPQQLLAERHIRPLLADAAHHALAGGQRHKRPHPARRPALAGGPLPGRQRESRLPGAAQGADRADHAGHPRPRDKRRGVRRTWRPPCPAASSSPTTPPSR